MCLASGPLIPINEHKDSSENQSAAQVNRFLFETGWRNQRKASGSMYTREHGVINAKMRHKFYGGETTVGGRGRDGK